MQELGERLPVVFALLFIAVLTVRQWALVLGAEMVETCRVSYAAGSEKNVRDM